MSRNHVNTLLDTLIKEAKAYGWRCELNPDPLIRATFRPLSLVGADAIAPAALLQSSNKGTIYDRQAASIGEYSVIIGSLGESWLEAAEAKDAHYEQAARARTWLDGYRQENLYLMLVGPSGSCDTRQWNDFAYSVERDESVCRKLVWLPPKPGDEFVHSIKRFCCRTFLARPWRLGEFEAELDPLQALIRQAGAKLPHAWANLLQQGISPGSELADQLINVLDDES